LYLTKIYTPNDYKGPLKGNPEFETHLQATLGDPSKAEDIRCAGEHAPSVYSRYDQNNPVYNGAVLVADSAEMAAFTATYGTEVGMSVISWEDDDTACTIKVEEDRFLKMAEAVAKAYPLIHAAIQMPNAKTITTAFPAVKTAAVAVANWLKSNDELIGTRTRSECTFPDGTKGNWTIVDGNSSGTTTTGCSLMIAHIQAAY
jgi:hypothetical protein